jgi:hypothetical protein
MLEVEAMEFADSSLDELLEAVREGRVAADAHELLRGILRDLRDRTYRQFLNSPPTPDNLVRFWAELRAIERLAQEVLRKAARGRRAQRVLFERIPSAQSRGRGAE